MAITLAQARLNTQDDIQRGVIDEFAKSNFLFNNLTFDDAVSPAGGGTTLTYGYSRLITQASAAFRAVNTEYTPQHVTKQRFTVDLKVFGGSFDIDRIIAGMNGLIDEVALQIQQKTKAASALFNETVINGDVAVNANAFDGLNKAVTGTSTEFIPTAALDLSTSAAIDNNYKAFLDILDEFLTGLDGRPSFIGGNTRLMACIRAAARRAVAHTVTRNNFGQPIEMYNDIPLVDFGDRVGSTLPVVDTNVTTGETSLYAARLALDGFHGVSLAGASPARTWLPDFRSAGAVKRGEVEMVAAVALKATKAAGVMRRIKVR